MDMKPPTILAWVATILKKTARGKVARMDRAPVPFPSLDPVVPVGPFTRTPGLGYTSEHICGTTFTSDLGLRHFYRSKKKINQSINIIKKYKSQWCWFHELIANPSVCHGPWFNKQSKQVTTGKNSSFRTQLTSARKHDSPRTSLHQQFTTLVLVKGLIQLYSS